jgi:beta-lactam-binding protein with PASTA domain
LTVPSLLGQSTGDAVTALLKAGDTPICWHYAAAVTAAATDRVIAQQPAPGTRLPHPERVALVISRPRGSNDSFDHCLQT